MSRPDHDRDHDRLPPIRSHRRISVGRSRGSRRIPVRRGRTPVPVAIPVLVVVGSTGLLASLVAAARTHFAAAQPDLAEAFLHLIQRSASHPGRTWRNLGRLHFKLGEFEAAGRAFGHAAAYQPHDAGLQTCLARTCLLLDDIPGFEGYLSRALALDPAHRPALEFLAELTLNHGNPAVAASLYRRLLKLRPGHRGHSQALALCQNRLGAQATLLHLLRRNRAHPFSSPPALPIGPNTGNSGRNCAHSPLGQGGASLCEL